MRACTMCICGGVCVHVYVYVGYVYTCIGCVCARVYVCACGGICVVTCMCVHVRVVRTHTHQGKRTVRGALRLTALHGWGAASHWLEVQTPPHPLGGGVSGREAQAQGAPGRGAWIWFSQESRVAPRGADRASRPAAKEVPALPLVRANTSSAWA